MKITKSHKSLDGFTEFYEHDSIQTKSLMKFSIFRPSKNEDIKGGLIWLSGLTCTEENFITKAGAQKLAGELGLVIICPDTSPRGLNLPGVKDSIYFGEGAGFYVDALTMGYKDHYRMYSYVNEEIYDFLNKTYKLNGNISIFGHSMGGHGALVIGLRNPDKYKSISALAPVSNPMKVEHWYENFKAYLGRDNNIWKTYDTCELLRSKKVHPNTILVDQGLEDESLKESLLTQNLKEACKLGGQEMNLRFHKEFDHSYYFVASFIEDHLRFHADFFK